jgi:1,4-dihydroxy-6-naphthoate synthase
MYDTTPNLCSELFAYIFSNNPVAALEFAKSWGRGIDEDTNMEFVRMYVNQRTVDYGADGRRAIRMFLGEGQDIGLIPKDLDCSNLKFIG